MKSFVLFYIALTSLLLSGLAYSSALKKDSVSVAFTFSMPPYLSTDLKSGIERDIIQSAFKATGIDSVAVHNVHYLRAIELSKTDTVDVIVSNQSNTTYQSALPNIVASSTTISYVDCAITLKRRKIELNKMTDYQGKRIWAFKSASEVLGHDFQQMSQQNPDYTEDFDQQKQLDMLAMQRIDIAISDRNIFTAKLKSSPDYSKLLFDFHPIGPRTPRVIRSTNKALIERFNEGLEQIRENGIYKEILDRYGSQYFDDCEL